MSRPRTARNATSRTTSEHYNFLSFLYQGLQSSPPCAMRHQEVHIDTALQIFVHSPGGIPIVFDPLELFPNDINELHIGVAQQRRCVAFFF